MTLSLDTTTPARPRPLAGGEAMDAAAWLRAARAETGLSQAELAGRLGTSVRNVQNWEAGRVAPAWVFYAMRELL